VSACLVVHQMNLAGDSIGGGEFGGIIKRYW
jgi:hypothetical protein